MKNDDGNFMTITGSVSIDALKAILRRVFSPKFRFAPLNEQKSLE